MSRYDKYDPKVGGFRAPLAANFGYTASLPDRAHVDLKKLFAAGMNTSGQIGKFGSAGFTLLVGVIILTSPKAAGDIVDVMTAGEIVELKSAELNVAGVGGALTAGQQLYADPAATTGVVTTTVTAARKIGFTVELVAATGSARLIVRVGLGSGTGA